jgi:hypothetical protein
VNLTRLLAMVCLLADQGGFTWTITFKTAVGELPQISVVDELTGIGHRTFTTTHVNVGALEDLSLSSLVSTCAF